MKCNKKCATKKVAAPKAKKAAPKAKKTVTKEVTFTFHAEAGKKVFVAGDFNDWNPSAKELAYKARRGLYTTTVKIAPGTHEYKFVVDGTWCADPENVNYVPNDQGTFNSVIDVK